MGQYDNKTWTEYRKREWHVVEYRNGKRHHVVAGLGFNAGKWDSTHTRQTAARWVRRLNGHKLPGLTFKVERAT